MRESVPQTPVTLDPSPTPHATTPVESAHRSLAGWEGLCKRSLDVSGALFGIALLGLPVAFLALCIRLNSSGPAFFFQRRVGLHGRVFTMLKLRTMRIDAEKNVPVWSLDDDPRCTSIGGFCGDSESTSYRSCGTCSAAR